MAFDPRTPFDDLPLLPPAVDVESKAVLKQCLTATRALAELKGAGGLIPDQAILINAIPLQEARLSSEIENIVTTQDELFRAAIDEASATDPQTREVLRYRTALRHGYESLAAGALSLELVREVCSILRDQPIWFRSAGEQVHIGNPLTGAVTYTPPRGGRSLVHKLRNLEQFLLAPDGPDPLIRMAVAHYQFEAIHPFTDGNGRAGRILNILYLIHAGLLTIPVLYLSRYIIQRKPDYYRLLREITEAGRWEPWLLYMLRGVEETASWTTDRIRAIRDLFDATVERCRAEAPKVYSKELVELIFRQPYCKIAFVVEAGVARRQTASEYLQELERLGVLVAEKRGREVIYKHPALLEVLTA
jgi:Fic family protein